MSSSEDLGASQTTDSCFHTPDRAVPRRVRNLRELWMLNNVRIHLDQVETLGNFLEFECLICESQTIDTAHEILRELRHAFQQAIGEPIDRSYADLLAAEQETPMEGV